MDRLTFLSLLLDFAHAHCSTMRMTHPTLDVDFCITLCHYKLLEEMEQQDYVQAHHQELLEDAFLNPV